MSCCIISCRIVSCRAVLYGAVAMLFHPTPVGNAAARVKNLQRLLRSLFYSVFAAVGGVYVSFEFHSWPHDLLHHHSPTVTILFETAIAHWILSLYEDYVAGTIMVSGVWGEEGEGAKKQRGELLMSRHIHPFIADKLIISLSLYLSICLSILFLSMSTPQTASHLMMRRSEKEVHSQLYLIGLLGHHLCTIAAFLHCLQTQKLNGLGMFGLLFEVPVSRWAGWLAPMVVAGSRHIINNKLCF